MDAETLIQILRYKCGLSIQEIANELQVSKKEIYNWIGGSKPFDETYVTILEKRVIENDLNIELVSNEVKEILDESKKIRNQDWKNLILGLQEKLNLEQFELLSRIGLKKDFHVSEWINGKRVPILEKKFNIIKLVKNLGVVSADLIEFGKNIRESIKLNDNWISVKFAQGILNTGRNPLIFEKGEAYLNIPALFPNYWNKNPIRFVNLEDKILVFYNEKRSTRPQPLVLPKHLKLDDDFLVGLGIYLGEGSRNRKPKVTNSAPLVINQAIKFFELFGIDRKRLRAWIQLHERSVKNFSEVRQFWLRNTFLKEENLTKIRIKKSSGSSKVKQYGVIHLEANFILLQLLIKRLIDAIPVIMTRIPNKQTIPFLQGAFAAEGSVEIAKSGSVREIRYTSTRRNERELIKKLLGKSGIVVHEYKKGFELRIHGFKNLKKLFEIEIFKYHPIRNERLIAGFKKLENFKKNH